MYMYVSAAFGTWCGIVVDLMLQSWYTALCCTSVQHNRVSKIEMKHWLKVAGSIHVRWCTGY